MKRCFLGLLFCCLSLGANEALERLGDSFQYLPVFGFAYSLAQEDYDGARDFAIALSASIATTFVIKYSFVGISKKNKKLAAISKRPSGDKYHGFPSGHTNSAATTAGFLQKRYGAHLGIPSLLLTAIVGTSRVIAKKHTVIQVIAGGIIGYSFGYFLTSKLDENTEIIINDHYVGLTFKF